jgi:hypothetical protein
LTKGDLFVTTVKKKRLTAAVARKRIAVAKDVLKSLRLRRIRLKNGVYVNPTSDAEEKTVIAALRGAEDLGEVVGVLEKNCEVCLLGACVLSKARLFDRVSARYGSYLGGFCPGRDGTVLALRDVFDDHELNLMEAAFERGWISMIGDGRGRENAACGFAENVRARSKAALVRAVMENVIFHGGRFVPEDYGNENPKFRVQKETA